MLSPASIIYYMSINFKQVKKELDLTDTMPFGKYLGLTLARVVNDDVKYIRWMMENSEQFFLSDKVHDLIKAVEYKQHLNQLHKTYYNHSIDYDLEEDVPF